MTARRTQMTTAGLNLIAQAMSIIDEDLRLVVCNTPFQQMFDLPADLAEPGARFDDIIRHLATQGEYGAIEDLETFIKERVDQALAFEPHYMERTRANGRVISVEGSPLPMGGWVAVYTDITEIKAQEALLHARSEELSEELLTRAEELAASNRKLAATITALEETKRQLTLSEAQSRLTTEMMPAHIAHVGPDAIYTYSNRRLSSVLPDRARDIVGMHMRDALGPTVYEKIIPHIQAAYHGAEPVFEFTDPVSMRRIRVAFTPDGIGGAYVLSMDITEETQTRVALQQTRRRTLAAQMTSGMAHDFSNLLTIILGMQGKLSRLDGLPDGATKLIEATLAATQRGGDLLSRIGDMTAARPYRPQAVDLAGLLPDFETLAQSTLPSGIRLKTCVEPMSDPVLLDPGMLQDALLNLILNARDACGAEGLIELRLRKVKGTWLEFQIEDTGGGFTQKSLDQALEPFFTTKGRDGSGLGLPMVYDMVKLAGGDLNLANGQNGALITLRLPLRAAPQVREGLVLLVEDEPELRAEIRDMLIGLGHAVIEAVSAEEALSLIHSVPDIALVLSDLNLKGQETGVDLAASVKNIPVLLMTSLPPEDPLHKAAARLAPVIRKPFVARTLADMIAPSVAA